MSYRLLNSTSFLTYFSVAGAVAPSAKEPHLILLTNQSINRSMDRSVNRSAQYRFLASCRKVPYVAIYIYIYHLI